MSEAAKLRRDVELALSGPDPLRVLPLLHRLAARAEDGSDECVFAHRQLAEVLLDRDPWRAALHARRVVGMRQDDDRAWAALGLSQSLLGNHQYASRALVRAVALAPENPWYAHNLGHTLDVALDKPREAVAHLRRAYARSDKNVDVATSLAHALARCGKTRAAKALLQRAMKQSPSPERRALMKWIDAGAPPRDKGEATVFGAVQLLATREEPSGLLDAPFTSEEGVPEAPPSQAQTRDRSPSRSGSRSARRWVQNALRRGLARLPLDEQQRAHASQIAREATQRKPPADERAAAGIAAAAAWSVIARAGIPLSQAEVAACFRTSASSLRQRLGAVRSIEDAWSRSGRTTLKRS
jgi:tetratricopeptide (TPR) repeat protein